MTSKVPFKRSAPSSLPEQISGQHQTVNVGTSRKKFKVTSTINCRLAPDFLIGVEPNPGPRQQKKKSKPSQKMTISRRRPSPSAMARSVALQNRAVNGAGFSSNRLPSTDEFQKYAYCLSNPFEHPPARSGVDCALPTGLFTLYLRRSYVIGAGGSTTTWIAHPRTFNAAFSADQATAPYNYTTVVPSFPQSVAATSIYNKGRIVSAGIRVRPLQPSTADQGQIAMVVMPSESIFETGRVPNLAPASNMYFGSAEILQHPNASVHAFRRGATVVWRPQDPNCFVFAQGLVESTGLTDLVETAQSVPYFAFTIANVAPGAAFEVEYVVHMEATIGTSYSGVVAVSPTLHSLPAATAMQTVKQIFGPTLNSSSFAGTIGGVLENLRDQSNQIYGGPSSKKKVNWTQVGSELLSFGSSLLPMLF